MIEDDTGSYTNVDVDEDGDGKCCKLWGPSKKFKYNRS